MRAVVFFLLFGVITVVCSANVARDPKCIQPLVTGRCEAYFPKFGYDPEKNECVSFVYGGCGGNDNSFDFKEDCVKACKA